MRENIHCCRRSERWFGGGRRAFKLPGAEPHYAPDLSVRLERLSLDVDVDPVAQVLSGTVTQVIRIVAPGQRRFSLDQIGLLIEDVCLGGERLAFSVEGQALNISLPEARKTPEPGDLLEFTIRYSVREPGRGLYFTGPDKFYPAKPYQVWSQGQDEDTRHWIPTFDYPNQKVLTEVIATVPNGYLAVSNGALLSRKDVGNKTRFHYRLGTPHVTYLISLVVAKFVELADLGPSELSVQYFVAPGREEDGQRAFGNTPKMIKAFAAKIGVPYPYEKYSQVAVQDFIFGGMENTSATTQTERTLHDARAHLDFSSDPLVSHELAHQWFGDLVTCRDWSNGWLNEGFATFMERVWIEANIDEYGSREAAFDEAQYFAFGDLKGYLEEDSKRYRRPIVCNTYIEPIDIFDAHLYQKGGVVLNMIRALLGEGEFWRAIELYVTRHRGGNVETLDLLRAIEDATGRNLRRLFDEWVFSGGHPELEVTYLWSDDKKLAEIVIEQKQTQGKSELIENGVVTKLFHVPVVIELTMENGVKTKHNIEIGELRDRIFLPAHSKPLMVRLDPGSAIPKTMKFPRPKEMLLFQLEHDEDCLGRIEAARELSKIVDHDVLAAAARALLNDRFWGVQAEVAEVLAEVRTDGARAALVAALKVSHPKARRAVVKALGTYKDVESEAALKKLAESDPSYFVEAEATHAWAAARSATDRSVVDETESFLISQLSKQSHLDVIRAAALRALGELPGIGRGERPKAVATLIEWCQRGRSDDARVAAIGAAGHVVSCANVSECARILELFSELSDEDNFRIRMKLVAALSEAAVPGAIPILEKIHRLDLDGRVKRDARVASDALTLSGTTPEAVSNLKASLEKLEEDHRRLKSLFEESRSK